jgi:hypothetical protein
MPDVDISDQLQAQLTDLTDELFELIGSEEMTDQDLRDAAEGLLPKLYDTLKDAGFGTSPTGPEI